MERLLSGTVTGKKDKSQKFTNPLQKGTVAGCVRNVPVTTVQMGADGKQLPEGHRTQQSTSRMEMAADSKQLPVGYSTQQSMSRT